MVSRKINEMKVKKKKTEQKKTRNAIFFTLSSSSREREEKINNSAGSFVCFLLIYFHFNVLRTAFFFASYKLNNIKLMIYIH